MIEFVSLNTIITDLLTIIRGSIVSQSEPISKRQIEKWVHEYRAILIKRDLDKGKYINPSYVQEIPGLQLELVDYTEATVFTSNEYIYRTSIPIPKSIDLNYKSGIVSVSTLLGVEIHLIPQGRSKWQKYRKYVSSEPTCYLKNQYLYVESTFPIQYITVRLLAEVPPEVNLLDNVYTIGDETYDLDMKYPIPINMVPVLKEMILKQELGILYKQPSDSVNDSDTKVLPNLVQPE